jgi:hypothetical protein
MSAMARIRSRAHPCAIAASTSGTGDPVKLPSLQRRQLFRIAVDSQNPLPAGPRVNAGRIRARHLRGSGSPSGFAPAGVARIGRQGSGTGKRQPRRRPRPSLGRRERETAALRHPNPSPGQRNWEATVAPSPETVAGAARTGDSGAPSPGNVATVASQRRKREAVITPSPRGVAGTRKRQPLPETSSQQRKRQPRSPATAVTGNSGHRQPGATGNTGTTRNRHQRKRRRAGTVAYAVAGAATASDSRSSLRHQS